MNLTADIIVSATGCRAVVAPAWVTPLQTAIEKFNIVGNQAIAAFLANVGVESESLTVFAEDMNYNAQELANTWPQRFATDPKAHKFNPNAQAIAIAYKPQTIANMVYANRMGNGDITSGDGWKYRGQGPIQLTGRQVFAMLAGLLNLQLVAHPEQMQLPGPGSLGSAWFFQSRGCVVAANEGNFAQVVKLINGAAPNDANQGPLREARYKAALAAMSAPITSAPTSSAPSPTSESPSKA